MTGQGQEFGMWLEELVQSGNGRITACDLVRVGELRPRYFVDGRVLTWGRHVVKHFSQPSPTQELILCVAEEMAWPAWFDDPLPHCGRQNPKTRLHDAIKNLKLHQQARLIRFKGDGTGTRVGWEYQ
jgi:hypothetical protein